jgi:hypothetical protein
MKLPARVLTHELHQGITKTENMNNIKVVLYNACSGVVKSGMGLLLILCRGAVDGQLEGRSTNKKYPLRGHPQRKGFPELHRLMEGETSSHTAASQIKLCRFLPRFRHFSKTHLVPLKIHWSDLSWYLLLDVCLVSHYIGTWQILYVGQRGVKHFSEALFNVSNATCYRVLRLVLVYC